MTLPCGTGKTVVAWSCFTSMLRLASSRGKPIICVFLAPSILLLQQTLEKWKDSPALGGYAYEGVPDWGHVVFCSVPSTDTRPQPSLVRRANLNKSNIYQNTREVQEHVN